MLAMKAYIVFYEKKWIFDSEQLQLQQSEMPAPLTRRRTLQNMVDEQAREKSNLKK